MKQYIAISLILCCSVIYTADQASKNLPVIESASYYIIDGVEKNILPDMIPASLMHQPLQEEYATLFNAAGDPIKRITQAECPVSDLQNILDPNAPKPHVTTYSFKYYPGYGLSGGGTKGNRYFVVLRDKNGNHITSYRCNRNTGEITVSSNPPKTISSVTELKDFDLAESVESDSDPLGLDVKKRERSCLIQ